MYTINTSKLIAVEGKDEVFFIKALLEHLKINIDNISILDVAGKDNFKKRLPALIRTSGFSKVKIFAIIRDADDNPVAAFQSIKDCLEKDKLLISDKPGVFTTNGNPRIGIFILPGNSSKGMLEDLCLETVQNHEAMKCVNLFSECIAKLKNPPKIIAKAKAQAFLAAMPKIVNSVGLGAKKGYWNFNSNSQWLCDLKKFLINFK